MGLDKDAPETRAIQSPEIGPIIAQARVDGLHHAYEQRPA